MSGADPTCPLPRLGTTAARRCCMPVSLGHMFYSSGNRHIARPGRRAAQTVPRNPAFVLPRTGESQPQATDGV